MVARWKVACFCRCRSYDASVGNKLAFCAIFNRSWDPMDLHDPLAGMQILAFDNASMPWYKSLMKIGDKEINIISLLNPLIKKLTEPHLLDPTTYQVERSFHHPRTAAPR